MRRSRNRGWKKKAAVIIGALAALVPFALARRRWKLAGGAGVSAQENKAIVRRLAEDVWAGNLDVIDELLDAKYVGYDPSMPKPIRGPAGFKDWVSTYRSAYSDARVTVEDQIAEGDKVATRWTGHGTHDGELLGISPTRKQVTVSGITVSRLKNGKVVESWQNWDTLGMLQQLGAVPELARAQ
jgi:steroid delta-isomerase-like uncharacterized protein